MIKSISKIAFATSITLALTFTFSCSSDDTNDSNDSSSSNLNVSSSSSEENSISSSSSDGGSVCLNASTEPVNAQNIGSVTCGGKTYKTVKIGEQVWMAENLNYNADNSKCYKNQDSYCAQYGRLYDWTTAVNVCPEGWHLPSYDEWRMLIFIAGGNEAAGTKLKTTQGWENGNGEDAYGFAALPSGIGGSSWESGFAGEGLVCNWWSATEYDLTRAYGFFINWGGIGFYAPTMSGETYKDNLYSIRCVQD